MAKTQEEQLFEQVEEVNDSALAQVPESERKPTINDPEWTEYVLSQLSDKEQRPYKGRQLPTTDGLRRMCTKLFGRIVYSRSRVVAPVSESNNYTATVEHDLKVIPYDSDYADVVEVTGAADVNGKNLDPPYNRYVTANASTRALGRALRDLLQLQVAVAEEVSKIAEVNEDDEDGEPITSAQKAAITNLCRRLGIDLDLFLNSGSSQYKSIDQVPQGTARQMLGRLNGYQSNPDKKIPEELKV